jgi:hypothetical protein
MSRKRKSPKAFAWSPEKGHHFNIRSAYAKNKHRGRTKGAFGNSGDKRPCFD